MHLHGHLASVIQDYGPVYSFLLFPYERLNGILGSYHANSQNISVQLMTRFWDHDLYSTYKWPQDMIDTFYPVVSKCKCNVGSLKQSTLETELSSDFIITPIPPIYEVYEDAFLKEEHQLALNVVLSMFPSCQVLLLFKVSLAIKVNDLVIGSSLSKYFKSSLLFIESIELNIAESLYEVEQFVGLKVVKESHEITRFWIAKVSVFMLHEYCYFFGKPVQVWSLTKKSYLLYIPIKSIKLVLLLSRCQSHF